MGRKRLTNQKVARLAGVNTEVISAARNGKTSVMLPSLKKVADALGLYLVGRPEKKAA